MRLATPSVLSEITDVYDLPTGRPIQFFDGLAGSGKTWRLAKIARHWAASGRKVIIAMISKHLIDETYRDYFLNANVPVTVIHSDNTPEDQDGLSVTKRLQAFFKEESDGGGQVLMVTHAGLLGMPWIEGKAAWSMIMDETPCPSAAYCLPLPDTHRIITDHLGIEDSDVPGYSKLVPTNRTALTRIASNKRDDIVYSVLRDVCDDLASQNRICYTRKQNFEQLLLSTKSSEPISLWIFSELNANIFDDYREVVVISALFRDTMLYKAWDRDEVNWTPANEKLWKVRDGSDTHSNGEHLKIYYATSKDYSKRIRSNSVKDGGIEMSMIENVIKRVENLFAGENFLFNVNKDIIDDDKWGGRLLSDVFTLNGTQLAGSPHGINQYKDDWHNVAIITALNPSPQHFAFQRARGIDGRSVKDALYRTTCYQMILRTSLRVPGDTNPKKVVVMDKATAEYLAALFPGAQVLYLPNLDAGEEVLAPTKPLGRPAVYETGADRVAACRDRKRIQARKMKLLDRINRLEINQLQLLVGPEKTEQVDYNRVVWIAEDEEIFGVTKAPIKNNMLEGFRYAIGRQMAFPLFRSRASKTATDFVTYNNSASFLEYLFRLTGKRVASKHENWLISTTGFVDKPEIETKIGRDNVSWTVGVWFDCDGDSDLAPEEFASWFPNLEMIVYATSKSTAANLRWRAYLPTNMGMDVEVYELIKDALVEVMNQHGYWTAKDFEKNKRLVGKRSGMDKGVWRPETKIYMPAVPADPGGAYSAIYVGPERAPIDIMAWIETKVETILERDDAVRAETRVTAPEKVFEPVTGNSTPTGLQHLRWQLKQQPVSSTYDRTAAVERATDQWRSTRAGNGNAEFWRYACRLQTIGLDAAEIEAQLRSDANMSYSSGSERMKEVSNIMRSLARRGRM